MVFVPGGTENGIRLTDYWLDRTEVTNRDFKAFVDRGGYENERRSSSSRTGLSMTSRSCSPLPP
jgi:formylglycine-generating enzyme required for sulfatase activity